MKLNGAMLRDARDRKKRKDGSVGLTQGEVADELGMSIATISNAENETDLRQETARRLCSFLEIDLTKAIVPRVRQDDGDAA